MHSKGGKEYADYRRCKKIISEAIAEKGCNGIQLYTEKSCCGRTLQIALVVISENEKADVVNGVSVLMDDETRQWTGSITIDEEGGQLKLIDVSSCCCS